MSFTPYTNSIEIDRFASAKEHSYKWVRILPKPDRKAQVAEFHELQSVANYLQQTNFSYIHDLYSIVQGLVVQYIETVGNKHKLTISSGQVYIEDLLVGALFVDVNEASFEIPASLSETSFVGLQIKILKLDSPEYNDPITGSEVSGTVGAFRALVEPNIIVRQASAPEQDIYPIAYIERDIYSLPRIIQYDNQRTDFTSTFRQKSRRLSYELATIVARRQQEEIGNFIVSGLHITCDGTRVKVSPGCCYIQGYAVNIPFPLAQQLPSPIINQGQPSRYFLTINEFATLLVLSDSGEQLLSPPQSSNTVYIGLVTIDQQNRCTVIDSENRIPTVAELEAIKSQHETNIVDTLDISSYLGLLSSNSSYDKTLFTPSLIDLRDSDTSHPLYNASLMPAIGAVRLGYQSEISKFNLDKELSNKSAYITKDTSAFTSNASFIEPDYCCTSFSETSALIQPDATSWVIMLNPTKTSAIMILSSSSSIADLAVKPNISLVPVNNRGNSRLWASQAQTNQNPYDSLRFAGASASLITPTSLPNIPSSILKQAATATPLKTKINFTNLLLSVNLNIKCYGFNQDEDNLILSFGYIQINNFTMVKGKAGSIVGTVKAQNGVVSLNFILPEQMPTGEHVVTLANDRISAKAVYVSSSATEFRYDNDFDNLTEPSPVAFFCNNYAKA